jgi:hypothetical protein
MERSSLFRIALTCEKVRSDVLINGLRGLPKPRTDRQQLSAVARGKLGASGMPWQDRGKP